MSEEFFPSTEPKPEDYPDRVNAYIRAHRRWQTMHYVLSVPSIPKDLEHLFTPESLEAARDQREKKQSL